MTDYPLLIQRADAFVNSEKELVISADIRSDGDWHYALVRNEFTLNNIIGKIN